MFVSDCCNLYNTAYNEKLILVLLEYNYYFMQICDHKQRLNQGSGKLDNPSFIDASTPLAASRVDGFWYLCVYRDALSLEERCIIITGKGLKGAYYFTRL